MVAAERLAEIEVLLRGLSAAQRGALLKAVTELFLESAKSYKPAQINLFGRLFCQLIHDTDAEALANLSRRLAPIANAPIETIDQLAKSDDINVAEPVIMRSPCLHDSMLAEIAQSKGQTHLLALACRPQLAAPIVDVLIARGDDVAVRYVANNRGAQISEASAAALAERAKGDDALADLIVKRSDIPAPIRKAIFAAKVKSSAAA